ncbi:hypothetical protein SAMN04488038_10770 [Solimonas aquatica]|uniref:DUF6455 domain-containing protein n=1 Tax=Solimonas aquatica TaxID=489703 RepID=A0A1H9GH03_9GAMM|nr:DUF6455 family protein [Solimonas aquatica]SEQ49336.1 hypothetical protein SAMN04488038_10770 [Solimonas aquatica]
MLHQSFASLLELAFGVQFLAVAAVLFTLLLADRYKDRLPLRQLLEAHFRRSLLYVMLGRRGRNTQAYLEQVSTRELEQHLQTCNGCPQRTQCIEVLREGLEPNCYNFCPNNGMIKRLGSTPG